MVTKNYTIQIIFQSSDFSPSKVAYRRARMITINGDVVIYNMSHKGRLLRSYITTSDNLPPEIATLCAMRFGIATPTDFPVTTEHPINPL